MELVTLAWAIFSLVVIISNLMDKQKWPIIGWDISRDFQLAIDIKTEGT